METKRCPRHNNGEGAVLPIGSFTRSKSKPSGYMSWCKKCVSQDLTIRNSRDRKLNPEKWKERDRKSYLSQKHRRYRERIKKNDPERWKRMQRNTDLKKHFGITIEQYESILFAQGSRCAICKKHESEEGKALAVDHCHKTNRVRGLLCQKCNRSLGLMNDNVERILAAADYLRQRQ